MAKRGPTLYELMGETSRLRGFVAPTDPGSGPREPGASVDTAGAIARTTMRVPLGYVLMAGAGVLAALLLAYSIGFQAGQNRQDRLDAQRLAAQATRGGATHDPLLEAGPGAAAAGLAPGADTRVAGLNYFFVALYPEALARRAAAFLRSQGVDATVVLNNASRGLYHVVSLRGFRREEIGTPAYTEHRARLMRLGRIWKRDHTGPTDFSDAWAAKFEPRVTPDVRASAPDE